MCICCKLTVLFEEPFWIGVFERTVTGQYQVHRHVFGAEPKDYEIYEFVITEYHRLKFSNPTPAEERVEKKISPKKLQKKISRELENVRVGTKAQNAIQLQHEANKAESKKHAKELKENLEKQKFELKQQKKKEKRKGH